MAEQKNIRRKAANSVCRQAKKAPKNKTVHQHRKKNESHSAAGEIFGAKCAKLMFKKEKIRAKLIQTDNDLNRYPKTEQKTPKTSQKSIKKPSKKPTSSTPKNKTIKHKPNHPCTRSQSGCGGAFRFLSLFISFLSFFTCNFISLYL